MKAKNKRIGTIMSCFLATLFFLLILISQIILPEANTFNTDERLSPPSLQHFFGTDQFGRDVLIRTIHGFRYTFVLAIIAQLISFSIGLVLGVALGYYGGVLDEVFFQISNVVLSFPMIIVAFLLSSLTGADMGCLMVLIIVYGIITNSKIVRGEVKVIKNADYIKTLKILGASDFLIIRKHLIRKSLRVLLPSLGLLIGHVIISISTYSFMGFGVQPPHPEIGTMLQESVRFMSSAPWLMILPGLFQFIAVLLILNLSRNIKTLLIESKRSF
jgi:peptide/nickel transport system permease protein